MPIVDPAFWNDLGRHILDCGAQSNEYPLPRRTVRPNRQKPGEKFVTEYRNEPMGVHGLHKWWYACLRRAGVVAQRQTSGERMHKARHTAGQRVLDLRAWCHWVASVIRSPTSVRPRRSCVVTRLAT